MTLLAAGCVGVFCYLVAGVVTSRPRRLRAWRRASGPNTQQLWLTQAGARLSPAQFWAGSLALGGVAFMGGWMLTRTPLIAIVPAAVVVALPRAYYSQRRATRLRAVQEAWPDGLRDLVASIAAGRSLTQAIISLASSGPSALQEAFARFALLSRMLGTQAALEVVKEEVADPTSDRVIEVLILAHERGGQIVKDILEDLVVATTKDLKVLDEIETEGLEMKINARAVLVLPWFVLVALTIRAGPFREFYQSGAGLAVVVAGAGLSVLGYAWISRLGRAHEEQRVFDAGAPVPEPVP